LSGREGNMKESNELENVCARGDIILNELQRSRRKKLGMEKRKSAWRKHPGYFVHLTKHPVSIKF
jgi:hypothetical protein